MKARSLPFLIVAMALACGRHHESKSSSGGSGQIPAMTFVRVPAGSFEMGADGRSDFDMGPLHRVTISHDFELQSTEVTQAQWTAVMGSNPSHFIGGDLPVENVSWNDAQEYLRKLNDLDPEKHYRLPTEAEWEYACRAGTTDPRYGDLQEIAWFIKNADHTTHPVGQKQPNAFGLYDMLGNVWELVADWKDSYPSGEVTDPTGPAKGYYKVSRGGSWFDAGGQVRAPFRASPEATYRGDSLGFRVARDAQH